MVALALEGLILLLLLTLGRPQIGREESGPALTSFDVRPVPEWAAEEEPEHERNDSARPAPPRPAEVATEESQPQAAPSPVPALRPQPQPSPSAPAFIPLTRDQMARADLARPAPVQGPIQGPPLGPQDRATQADSVVVGTAPDGEPLYAAAWYRRPFDDELSGYLSTASGPGWGLIACRTVADYRVEDCVALEESPRGSNIARSVLAAAWQFKVRPPSVGGRSLVGTWVRIRIDYDIHQR